MFGTVLTVLITLMQLYVLGRAASLPALRGRRPRLWLWGAGAALWLLFVLARTVGHDGAGRLAGLLESAGMTWMALLFITSAALLAADLATGFGLWAKPLLPAVRCGALAAGLLLAGFALVQGHRAPAVVAYEVPMEGLPPALDGTRLAVLSDTHLGAQLGPQWFGERVDQTLALRPDAILLLGDIFEGHGRAEEELLPVLLRLRAPLGVWAVSGNHESHGSGTSLKLLEDAGIPLLRDRWADAAPGLVFAGVDDLNRRRRHGEDVGVMEKALAGRPPGAVVLLSHAPWRAEEAAAAGAGLMVSGHTHDGQIWPFNVLVALEYPLVGGRYEVGGMAVLVSRGTGTWGPRMRLWRRGEILDITLRSAPQGRETSEEAVLEGAALAPRQATDRPPPPARGTRRAAR